MASHDKARGGGVIVVTLLIATVLMIIPMPDKLAYMRPEWVLLTLMYWVIALPHRIGVGYAWLIGLLMDILQGGYLGILALTYSLIVYLVLRLHLQIRQFPIWQQALTIMSLLLAVNIIMSVMTARPLIWEACLPAIISTAIWPFSYRFLRLIRYSFNVN